MAGRIPQSFINDLLARVDIVEVVDPRLTLKKAGKDYQALCPFHNEKTPSFTVSPDKQFYHCFGCGESGTALTFLIEHDRMEFVEAVETLAQLAGVEVPRERQAAPRRDATDLYDALARADAHFRRMLRGAPAAIEYLKQRGLTGVTARNFGIGFAPDQWHGLAAALADVNEKQLLEAGLIVRGDKGRPYDRFRGRITFPIRDTRGRVIGFGGRVMDADSTPKYLNSPETPVFHKGRELYGLYEARKALRRIERMLVVEGYMDVVALAQAGIANVVASLGTAATREHFHKLYRYTGEVICCFDGDAAGRQAAWRALENALPELRDGRSLKFMFLPEGEDPDSMIRTQGEAAFRRRVAESVPAIEYLFSRLAENLDLSQLDDQARLASLVMTHVDRLPEGILKELMLNRLQTVTGFRPGDRRPPPRRNGRADEPARNAGDGLSPLSRRLAGYLFRKPSLVAALENELAQRLGGLSVEDPFVDMAGYLRSHPEAQVPELLGRWAGHALHRELVRLAENPPDIDDDALAVEFADGVKRLLEQRQRADRRRLLAELKQDPSADKLRQFWSLKQGAGEAK